MKKLASLLLVFVLLAGGVVTVSAEEYEVQDGDELWKIARDNDTTVEAIVSLNNIKNRNLIYSGQIIELPEGKNMETTKQESNEKEAVTISNTEKAVALLNSFGTGNTDAIYNYVSDETYIQHNLNAGDGRDGLVGLVKGIGMFSANNVRVFEDGDYVFLHTDYEFFGPKVGFDIFRFEDGLIIEHWDNLSDIAEDINPSGRGQLDGTKVIKDLDKTEENKGIVKGFVTDILMGGAPEKLTHYISSEKYFQHNTGVADGLEGLEAAMVAAAEAGMPMVYNENHMVLGQGNFVLSVSEGVFMDEHVSFYDLFRIEDGLIVEHWDVIETILPEVEWKNTNGKF